MRKKSFFILALLFCGLLINIQAWVDNKSILVVGDSISTAYGMDYEQGWVTLLEQRLTENGLNYDVINASITGDVTASGRNRIKKQLQQHTPNVVVIELGGNDGLRGLSISQMKSNLQSMIDDSLNGGAKVVLAGMKILPNYGPRYTNDFANVYIELAQENDIVLVPFVLEGIGGVSAMMQSDGIHPNDKAQSVILDNLWPWMEGLL